MTDIPVDGDMSATPTAIVANGEARPAGDAASEPALSAPRSRRRRARWALWAGLLVALPIISLLIVLGRAGPAGTKAADSPLLGKPAPTAAGTTIDGTTVSLSGLRGRWVLVNFFATWCVPCRNEHPDLVTFAARHAVTGDATILGIVFDDSADAVRSFRAEQGGDWPMLEDPGAKIGLNFGISGVPESFLISPRGVVTAKYLGGVHLAQLERLLANAKRRSA